MAEQQAPPAPPKPEAGRGFGRGPAAGPGDKKGKRPERKKEEV